MTKHVVRPQECARTMELLALLVGNVAMHTIVTAEDLFGTAGAVAVAGARVCHSFKQDNH